MTRRRKGAPKAFLAALNQSRIVDRRPVQGNDLMARLRAKTSILAYEADVSPAHAPVNPDGSEAADLISLLIETLGRIASEARQSADTHGCANCNAFAEIANLALAAAAHQGGDVQQAPAESPQSGPATRGNAQKVQP